MPRNLQKSMQKLLLGGFKMIKKSDKNDHSEKQKTSRNAGLARSLAGFVGFKKPKAIVSCKVYTNDLMFG